MLSPLFAANSHMHDSENRVWRPSTARVRTSNYLFIYLFIYSCW